MRTLAEVMKDVDELVYAPKVLPYRGWHDDYTPGMRYMPAMQQAKFEFEKLLLAIARTGTNNALQLGLGPSKASHPVWVRVGFTHVTTIDFAMCIRDDEICNGNSTHSLAAIAFARKYAPYDFLFIDAGHTYEDVAQDYRDYAPMVRRGGLIAFHDALERAGYPEVEVHKFIKDMPVVVFGDEVGTALMVTE